MIYPQKFHKMGFDKVRRLISEKCLSPLGEERGGRDEILADYQTVLYAWKQLTSLFVSCTEKTSFPPVIFLMCVIR